MRASTFILISFSCVILQVAAEQQRVRVTTEPNYPLETGFHANDGKSDRGGGYILEKALNGQPQRNYCFDRRAKSKHKVRLLSGALHFSHDGAKEVSHAQALEVFKRFETKLMKYHGNAKFQLLKAWASREKDPPEDLPNAKDFSEQLTTISVLESINSYQAKK